MDKTEKTKEFLDKFQKLLDEYEMEFELLLKFKPKLKNGNGTDK